MLINHIHILLQVTDKGNQVFRMYLRSLNQKNNRLHFWEGRYLRIMRSQQSQLFWIILTLSFMMFPLSSGAQSIDSVILNARKLMIHNPDSARALLEPSLERARAQQDYAGMVPLLHQLSIVALIKGDDQQSRDFNKAALESAKLSGERMLLANSYSKMANDYRKSGKHDSAVAMYMDAINAYHKTEAEGFAWASYVGLGDIATDNNRTGDAERHYLKAWDVVKTLHSPKDEIIVAGTLRHFFITTGKQEQYAAILEDVLQRNPYFSEDINQVNAHYHPLLHVYSSDQASIESLKKSIALHYRMDNQASIVTSLTRLGNLLTQGGHFDEGLDTLKHAIDISSSKSHVQMRLNYMAYQNRKSAGDYQSALQYLDHYHAIKNSTNSEKALANIRELEVQYDTREKELALVREQELTRLRTWQRNFMILLAAAILWFSLFGILFFWNRSRLQKRITAQTEAIKNQQIQQLEQEKKLLMMSSMIEGQEAERKRIAQDLHDGLGGLLSSVKAQLNLIQHQVSQLESMDTYQKASNMIDHASSELRRIAFNMMPSALTKLGLREATEDLAETLKNDHQLDVDLQIFGFNGRLDETEEIMIYRILQELSNNIVKHADASRVLIQINKTDDDLFLVVEDNGKGFNPHNANKTSGMGMKSLESRVRFLNGDLDVSSEPEKGTCITVHIPLNRSTREIPLNQ